MNSATLSSMGFDMPYRATPHQNMSSVQYSATGLAKTITSGHSSYFPKDNLGDSLWQILNDLLTAFTLIGGCPEHAALIQVDRDVEKLLVQLKIKDYRTFSVADQPFINFLEQVHTGLLNLVDRMVKNNFSHKEIATFDDYANRIHAWHTRLTDSIDPEMQELLRRAASIRALK